MPHIAVTGANRGIGLEFVRQYAGDGWRVSAGSRRPADASELTRLAHETQGLIDVLPLDVVEEASIGVFAATVNASPVDILINNAGIFGPADQDFGDIDAEGWLVAFRTNAIAPLLVTRALMPALRAGAGMVVVITSRVGSIGECGGGRYAYRTSKAAANMVVKAMAADLAADGVTAVALHPGWVRTDMGGAQAPLTAADSAARMREVITGLRPQDSGRFLDHDGTEIPW